MCSLTTLWDLAQSFSRLLWHHESGKSSNICRFNFLHLLFNKGIHMNISQKIFCSDILQLLSNGNKWFKSWPFLTLTYFQKILRPKRPVRATCVSLELFSIDWSHRWIPICCYSIHFWIYSKKKKRTTFDTGHKETAYSLILISSVKYGCTVPTLHKSGWARGLREQNVNHHLFANPYILLWNLLPKEQLFLICIKLRLIYLYLYESLD